MSARSRCHVVLIGLLALGCPTSDGGDELASESESGESENGESGTAETDTTTGEPDPCEGLEPVLPAFDADAFYFNGGITISNCSYTITVPITEDQLIEGTDADYYGNYATCTCGDEYICGDPCASSTRLTISHVDEHCVVGTLREALAGEPDACIPEGGFVIRR